jgi:hypothetical protein
MSPMCYTASLATPGNSACSGTPNTEVCTYSIRPAAAVPAASVLLQAVYVIGKGAGLTAISGISFRLIRCTTATVTTGGVATTPNPKDAGMQAATATAVTGATTISSTGRTNHVIFGCGAAGPGGYVAPNPDSVLAVRPASTVPSIDITNQSGTASLNYEWSAEHQE